MKGREILIVAGEASGDHYGADLVHRLSELDPELRFFGMGGDRMATVGVELVEHIKEVTVMGFLEVLSRLGPLYRSFRKLVAAARTRQPAAAIFIDFPDYNLRLAPRIREVCRAKTIYYIGPTVWAWRAGRVAQIQQAIDRMIVIFPFEEPIYRKAGVDVAFVGHPLVGTVRTRTGTAAEFHKTFGLGADRRLIGLLPGSRAREVAQILPTLLSAADRLIAEHGPLEIAIGLADSIDRAQVEAMLPPGSPVRIIERGTPDLMRYADVLLVASGTAPLEAAILGTPQVVVYRTTPLTYGIASRMVTVDHVCMVNLILERRAVPELIQDQLTPARVAEEASRLLSDASAREAQEDAFRELRKRLGAAGASRRAAESVLGLIGGGVSATKAGSLLSPT